jgi:hypothetical protein
MSSIHGFIRTGFDRQFQSAISNQQSKISNPYGEMLIAEF